MIKVIAKQFVTEGKLDDFLPLAKKLVEETNAKDAGCIRYEMYQDLENPLVVTVIEEWETQEALDAHMQSGHFLELIPHIGDACDCPADVTLYKKLF